MAEAGKSHHELKQELEQQLDNLKLHSNENRSQLDETIADGLNFLGNGLFEMYDNLEAERSEFMAMFSEINAIMNLMHKLDETIKYERAALNNKDVSLAVMKFRIGEMMTELTDLTQQISVISNRMQNLCNRLLNPKDLIITNYSEEHVKRKRTESCICSDKFKLNETVTECPQCGHCFHRKCIARWLSESAMIPTCPFCKLMLNPLTEN